MKIPLILDGSNSSKPSGTIVYAKNKVIDYLKSNIKNEDGFEEVRLGVGTLSYYTFIGSIETPNCLVTFSIQRKKGAQNEFSVISTITVINNVIQVTDIVATENYQGTGLDFRIDNPIQGDFSFNIYKELNIAFIEGIGATANSLRYLNVDNSGLPFITSEGYTCMVSDMSEIDNLASDRLLTLPIIELDGSTETGLVENGSLTVGVYVLYVAYSDNKGNTTNYINSLNPITIELPISFDNVPDNLDAISNQGIQVKLTNLDTNFKYLSLGIVRQSNGNSFAFTKLVPYAVDNVIVTIDNLNYLEIADPSEFYVDTTILGKVNAIAKFDNQLLVANTTVAERKSRYDVGVNAVVEWKATTMSSRYEEHVQNGNYWAHGGKKRTYSNQNHVVNAKTFQPDEVYALYIQPILKDGTVAESIIICPPAVSTIDVSTVDNLVTETYKENAALCDGCGLGDDMLVDVSMFAQFRSLYETDVNIKLYEAINMGTVTSANKGDCGLWENQNELYPADHPYAGEKVRHFRMPDYKIVNETVIDDYRGVRLTLDISNIDFSAYPDVQGYNILIAKRSEENSTVFDEAAIYNMIKPANQTINENDYLPIDRLTTTVWGGERLVGTNRLTTGNKVITVVKEVGDLQPNVDSNYALYAPKTFKFNNEPRCDYLKVESIFVQKSVYEYTDIVFNQGSFTSYPHNDTNTLRPMDCDFDNCSERLYNPTETVLSDIAKFPFIKINSLKTIVGNTKVGFADAQGANTYIHAVSDDLKKFINIANLTYEIIKDEFTPLQYHELGKDMVFGKVLMKTHKNDMYYPYYEQVLAKVGTALITDTSIEVGGDSYYNGVAMRVDNKRTAAPCLLPYYSPENFDLRAPTNASEVLYGITTPTEDNYWDTSELCSEFWLDWSNGGTTGDNSNYHNVRHKWLGKEALALEYWGVGYRSIKHDWALLNDKKVASVYTLEHDYLDRFPYRIYKSLPTQSESLFDAWRIFEPLSYEELDNARGEVMTLDVVSNMLYVRQRFALVVYRVVDATESVNTVTVLGRAQLFSTRGVEVIGDTLGYVGSNSRFNSLVTPFGYFVIDVLNKEVYKVTETNAVPITTGVAGFLQKHIREGLVNPYNEGDIILGYNDEDKMLLLTCIDNQHRLLHKNDSFTLSYPMFNDGFFSFHFYVPNMYSNTTAHTFSLVSSKDAEIDGRRGGVYRHNFKPTKCLYYSNDVAQRVAESDILDTLFNGGGKEAITNKILEYVEWITESKYTDVKTGNSRIVDTTIDELLVYSDTQCSITHQIKHIDLDWYETKHGRNIQNKWAFNDLVDAIDNAYGLIIDEDFNINQANIINKDYYDLSYFIGTFAIIRTIYNNVPIATDKYVEQTLIMVNAKFSQSNR